MVDRLLGGQGAAMDRLRDMTTLETTIVKRMIEQSLEELTGAGFELVDEWGFLPRQWFLMLRPKTAE
jgi:flagellar motor switch protein FliM